MVTITMRKAVFLHSQKFDENRDNHGIISRLSLKNLPSFRWAGSKKTKISRDDEGADSGTVEHDEGKGRRSKSFRNVLVGLISNRTRKKSTDTELDGSESRSEPAGTEDDELLDMTAVSTPTEPLSVDSPVVAPRMRNVSFNDVVNELTIETRKQRYGDLAAKSEAFYTHAELATFKRAWRWQNQSKKRPRMDTPMKCECMWCVKTDEMAPAQEVASLEDYTKWTWEG